jgi:peptidoglycan/xylan/chitin deacetylase (PgdA/CDA1 family)
MAMLTGCAGQIHFSEKPQSQPEIFPQADKYIALSFDDGPMALTGQLLETLKENNVKATFFLIGRNIRLRPDGVRAIIADGHEIGNHSDDHSYLGVNSKLDENGIRQNIAAVQEAIFGITDAYPAYFRAPYLDYSQTLEKVVKEMGMAFIGVSVDSNDWNNGITTERIVSNVLNSARDGGIILMHEHSAGDLERTIRAVPIIITELRKRGYEILSVSDLAQKKGIRLEAGKRYNSL